MTRSYVVVCNNWEPGCRLYFDFNENVFYIDNLNREPDETKTHNKPSLLGSIIPTLLVCIIAILSPRDVSYLFGAVVTLIPMATLFAYAIHREERGKPNERFLQNGVVKVCICSSRYNELAQRIQKRFIPWLTVCGTLFGIFLVCLLLLALFDRFVFSALGALVWYLFVAVFLSLNLHKMIKFFIQYKKEKISL